VKGPRSGEGWFYRRGALCAPAWEVFRYVEAVHYLPRDGLGGQWHKGVCSVQALAFFAGVRSPPLRDVVNGRLQALPGKARKGARGSVLWRDALRASAYYGNTDAQAFHYR